MSGLLVGCASFHGASTDSSCTDCVSESCEPGCNECATCEAGGNCETCIKEEKIKRGSEEWWAIQAESPVGARQVYKKGKLWPPFPRPTGEKQQFSHKYHAAHYWPYPYACQDRAYVNNVFDKQTDKGWVKLTTLFDHHFDEETNELTHAGYEQVVWILEEAPRKRAQKIYVQKLPQTEKNAVRVENVRNILIELAGQKANNIEIVLQAGRNYGRPAQEIDTIRKAELSSMPEPRIQYTAPSTTSSEE